MQEKLDERLKNLRKSAGLSQSNLAEKLNVHTQTISKWERGVSEPDIGQLGEIAAILGVSLEKLFGCQEGEKTYNGNFSAENLGQYISALRTQKSENQQKLAEICSVSSDAVSRWERGVTCPDINSLRLLAEHFDIPVSKLYYAVPDEVAAPTVIKAKKKRTAVAILAGSLAAVTAAAAALLTVFLVKEQNADKKIPVTVTVDGVPQTVNQNDWFMPQTENRAGYDFVEWQDGEGNKVSIPYQVTKDCVFNSVYSPRVYYIDYWLNGGAFETSEVQHVFTVESGAVSLLSPTKSGAVFEGWYQTGDYSDNAVMQITCQAENVALYAKWSDATYTVRYELNGGILQDRNPTTVSAENEVVLLNPLRKGYLFVGWYDSAVGGTRYETVGGQNGKNLTLYAQWQKSDAIYNIHYELNGGTLSKQNPETVELGEVYSLNSPAKAGYEFLGWNDKEDGTGKFYTNLYGIQNDLSLYALYEAKEYLIRYEYEGIYANDETNPNFITFGERITLNPVYKNFYTFTGWFDSEEGGNKVEVIDESNLLGITRLYARFTPNVYKITLNADEGSFRSPDGEVQTYIYNLTVEDRFTLPDCMKGGYVFLGWRNKNGESVDAIDALNLADCTLTAAWRESDKRYTITYELNGGTLKEENPESVLCGQNLSIHEPEKEHYIFLGWYDDNAGQGNKYNFTPIDRETDLMLYAIWQEIKISGSSKDFIYEKNTASETITITGYKGSFGENVDLVIPAVIEGLPVVAIEGMRNDTAQKLHSLTIPEGIVKLGESALRSLTIEQPVTIPASVEIIGKECFYECNFSELYFAEGSKLKTIGENAFCLARIESVLHLPEGLEELGYQSFYAASMAGIILPDSLKRIYSGALILNSQSIKGIYLPQSVEYIATRSVRQEYAVIYAACSQEWAETNFDPVWHSGDNNLSGTSSVYYGVQSATVILHDEGNVTELKGNTFELPVPQREGYTFIGWKDLKGQYVNQFLTTDVNYELYAVYEEISEHDGRELDRAALLKEGMDYEFDIRGGTYFYFKPEDSTARQVVVSYSTASKYVNSIYCFNGDEYSVAGEGKAVTISPQGYCRVNLQYYPIVSHISIRISIIK